MLQWFLTIFTRSAVLLLLLMLLLVAPGLNEVFFPALLQRTKKFRAKWQSGTCSVKLAPPTNPVLGK